MDIKSKNKSRAFGNDCYYLGMLDERAVWLEQSTWDCGWYWGCGYIEEYTRHMAPSNSKDISMHTHIDTVFKEVPFYDVEKCEEKLNFTTPHLNQSERYKLADLFKSMYTLREAAAVIGRGSSHISEIKSFDKNVDMAKSINKNLLPKVFEAIYSILNND